MMTGELDWYANAGFIIDTIIANHKVPESDLMEFIVCHFLDTLSTEDRLILVKYLYSMEPGSIELEYQRDIRAYFEPKMAKVRGYQVLLLISDKLVESSEERMKIFIQGDDKIEWTPALPTDRIAALKSLISSSFVPPARLSRLVGFMQVFRNDDIVFKTMDMQNKLKKGSRCGGEGKKDVMKKINIVEANGFQYTEANTEDTELGKNLIVKPGMCIIMEMLFRYYNKAAREGLVWFLDLERAVLSKLVK
jgi:hypothetical protein